jgi:hypothetical protein
MVVDGIVEPMELGHLPYRDATFEAYVGVRGFKKYGQEKWREYVSDVVIRRKAALEPEDIVPGGGNVNNLASLPSGCRAGDNSNAFTGGFRVWLPSKERILSSAGTPLKAHCTIGKK